MSGIVFQRPARLFLRYHIAPVKSAIAIHPSPAWDQDGAGSMLLAFLRTRDGINNGNRRHVDNTAHGNRRADDVG
ncbi:hypothetical protein GCM10009100_33120 [Thalassospira tepidiphila]